MTAGLLIYDLLYLLASFTFYGAAARAAMEITVGLTPMWLALPAAVCVFLLSLIALSGVVCACLPRLEPGTYDLMKGRVFYGWLLRSLVRRVVFFGPLKPAIFSVNLFRFLALRAQGARVAFTANVSSDVDLLDPALLGVGPGATLGARCLISGHYVIGRRLVLDRVEIGANTLLAAEVAVMPGVRIGARVFAEPQVSIGRDTVVGDGARIGRRTVLDLGVRVAADEIVPPYVVIRSREAGAEPTAAASDTRPAE